MVGGSTRSGLFKNYIENLIFLKSSPNFGIGLIKYNSSIFFRKQAKPVLKNLSNDQTMIGYPFFDPMSKINMPKYR